MNQQQIETAARGLWDDWLLAERKEDEYSALEIPFDGADEMYRLWKKRLTDFAQQAEADALERAGLFTREQVEATKDEILSHREEYQEANEEDDLIFYDHVNTASINQAFAKLLKPKAL